MTVNDLQKWCKGPFSFKLQRQEALFSQIFLISNFIPNLTWSDLSVQICIMSLRKMSHANRIIVSIQIFRWGRKEGYMVRSRRPSGTCSSVVRSDRFHCIPLVKTIFFPNFLRENAYIPHVAFRICCVSKVLLVLKGKALWTLEDDFQPPLMLIV